MALCVELTVFRNDLAEVFDINVVGTHNVTKAFRPLVEQSKAKKIVNISSTLGSIENNATIWKDFLKDLPVPAYKITKAALSMLTVQYALEAEDKGITVFQLSPGVSQLFAFRHLKGDTPADVIHAVAQNRYGRPEGRLGHQRWGQAFSGRHSLG